MHTDQLYDDGSGVPCMSEAQAYHVGTRIAVKPIGGVDCSSPDLGTDTEA
jgi:hypothetical protein